MADEVGALRVTLSADTAQFERDMGKAQASASRLGSLIGSRLGLAIGGAAAGFLTVSRALQVFNTAIDEVSKIANLADRLGLTTREMQTLAGAAEQAGVDFRTLETTATQLGSRLQTGLRNPLSDVSQLLRTLGVDVRNADGSMRSFADLLPDLADAFSRFADDENKMIVATRLFGQAAGPQMAQFLSQGSAAIEEQRRKLDQFLPRLDVVAVRNFEDANTKLEAAMKDLSIQFGQLAAGPAAEVVKALADLARWLSETTGRNLPTAARAMEELSRVTIELRTALANLARDDAWGTIARGVNRAFGNADSLIASLSKRVEELQAQLAAAVKQDEEAAAQAAARRGQTDGRPSISLPDPKALAEMQAQLAATMTALSGQDPTKSIINQYLFGGKEPAVWTDAFRNAMAEIDRIGKASGQTATQIANQKIGAMQREQNLMSETAQMAASTLTSVFADNKAAAIAAAAINTAVGITRALQLPPPFSWIQAGLIAASGAAQIATIRSSSPGSASTPSVNGGAGGDATTVAPQTLIVQGIDPKGIFSGEAVRDLAERLVQFQRDGGQVVIQ